MIKLPGLPADYAEIHWQSVAALHSRLREGTLQADALTEHFLARIAALDGDLKAFVGVHADEARAAASEAAARFAAGRPLGPLDGIPVAIKDNIAIRRHATAAGTAARKSRVASADATVVTRLRAAGAVILGRLNMHEGAFGSSTDNPWFGTCRNPHRLDLIPGGSSGGAGAAVAAGLCTLAVGTDTLGSIREPAHFCGVVGHKPTFGLISAHGVTPMCHRLDTVGPLARSVADAIAALAVMSGADPAYFWSRREPTTLEPPASMRLGILDLDGLDIEPAVMSAYRDALACVTRAGYPVAEIGPPPFDMLGLARAAALGCAADSAVEFAAEIARGREGLSEDFCASLQRGISATATDLAAAWASVEGHSSAFHALFERADVLVTPTCGRGAISIADAPAIGLSTTTLVGWVNAMGAPAVSIPMGWSPGATPLGLQFIARPGADAAILAAAAAYERAAGHDMRPANRFGRLPA